MKQADIDNWIELGELRERQRIIKLLREHFDDTGLWRQIEWSPDVYQGFNKQELIELINGEQK